jgi:hypothetical protein
MLCSGREAGRAALPSGGPRELRGPGARLLAPPALAPLFTLAGRSLFVVLLEGGVAPGS